ncbi:hypothetical protein ASD04_07060 [Devosia sp. Root436]|uniref:hypothetical protein n=1 Tax=Devosia sp. Root436 TaxID=1736537 RepID=UPI0006FA66E1|nr:hypothetical protein [Devosia sp. Root436]KQX40382.1 hypothetical protein ASD04_07060 [Devosia sp. Root436]
MKYEFTDAKGETIDEPKGFLKQRSFEVDGRSIENPNYVTHKRGKNWAARMDGPNAAEPQRTYLPTKGSVVDVQQVKAGDAFVVAGDYVTSGNNYCPDRMWGVIHTLTDRVMILDVYETEAKAISARNKGVRADLVPDEKDDDDAALENAFPVGFDVSPSWNAGSTEKH